MATKVTIRGTGESSDYSLAFDGSITDTENLEFDDFVTKSRGEVYGTIIDGEDIYFGEGDVVIQNVEGGAVFGDTPNIIAEVGGITRTITPGEIVTFEVEDDGSNGGVSPVPKTEVIISNNIDAASDYRIKSDGRVSKVSDIESVGDNIVQVDPGIIEGTVKGGRDVWSVSIPFTVKNIGSASELIVNRDIDVEFGDGSFNLETGDTLFFDGTEARVERDGNGDFNLLEWASNNPGQAIAGGVITLVAVRTATDTLLGD